MEKIKYSKSVSAKKLRKYLLILLSLFLLVFPKGGIKIGALPLTWGYLLLFFLGISVLLVKKNYSLSKQAYQAYFATLPWQLIIFITLATNGVADWNFALSLILGFSFLPLLFFFILADEIEKIDKTLFYSIVRKAFLFLSILGIALFIYRMVIGSFFTIPLLTINLQDIGALDEKCNVRSNIVKLTSTFNNGNLYGICLLMLFPLYLLLEKSFWKTFLVRSSLVLTTSRTVWIGLLIGEFFNSFIIRKEKKKMRFFLKFLILDIVLISATYYFFNFSNEFIVDQNLGGRISQVERVKDITFFPTEPFENIEEILYLGVIKSFGITSLIPFLIAMLTPLYLFLRTEKAHNPVKRAIFSGLILYLIISCSDGAILYIPVLVFYWFLAAFLLKRPELSPMRSV